LEEIRVRRLITYLLQVTDKLYHFKSFSFSIMTWSKEYRMSMSQMTTSFIAL